jgi:fructose-specific component phosphotransferase system IIB-like protein
MMSAPATNHDADLGKVAADFIKNSSRLIGAIVLMGGAGGAMQT